MQSERKMGLRAATKPPQPRDELSVFHLEDSPPKLGTDIAIDDNVEASVLNVAEEFADNSTWLIRYHLWTDAPSEFSDSFRTPRKLP